MACVVFILPAFLLVFDRFIQSWTWKGKLKKKVKEKIAEKKTANAEN